MEVGMDVWDEARAKCEADVKEFHKKGLWPTVLKEIADYKVKGKGGMSDASKRQRSDSPPPAGGQPSHVPAAIPEHGLGNFTPPAAYPNRYAPPSPGAASYSSSATSTTPIGSAPATPAGPVELPYALPSGVSSMEEWGRTIINFGKYGGKRCSYSELAVDDSDEAGSYRFWVMSRVNVQSESLSDLARFFCNRSKMGTLGIRICGLPSKKNFNRQFAEN